MTIRLKDYEKIVPEMIIIGLKEGKLFNRLHFFFDIHQKITNKTRIFMHFIPRNR